MSRTKVRNLTRFASLLCVLTQQEDTKWNGIVLRSWTRILILVLLLQYRLVFHIINADKSICYAQYRSWRTLVRIRHKTEFLRSSWCFWNIDCEFACLVKANTLDTNPNHLLVREETPRRLWLQRADWLLDTALHVPLTDRLAGLLPCDLCLISKALNMYVLRWLRPEHAIHSATCTKPLSVRTYATPRAMSSSDCTTARGNTVTRTVVRMASVLFDVLNTYIPAACCLLTRLLYCCQCVSN
jgi:hypothetical protein